MRNPARESADPFHLLGLAELGLQGRPLRFRLLPFRDVASDAEHRRLTAELDHRREHLNGDEGAVAPDVGRLEREASLLLKGRDSLGDQRRLLRRVDVGDGHADEFFLSISEAVAGGLVGLEESTGKVTDEDGIAGVFEQRAETCFRASQRLLGFITSRDVYRGGGYARYPTVLRLERSSGDHQSSQAAVAERHRDLVDLGGLAAQDRRVVCFMDGR